MPTAYPDLFAALAAPFEAHEVRVRAQAGRQLHYVTARTVMNRLDEVLGPENWWDQFVPGENSVLCAITIRLPDGTTLTKHDAGGYAGMPDQGDDDKSGFSDGFKRAAVKFGVSRYLYRDGVPKFVRDREPAVNQAPTSAHPPDPQHQANGQAPTRDERPAQPNAQANGQASHGGHPGPSNGQAPRSGGGGNSNGPQPRTGRHLFAWVKECEQRHEVGLLKYLNSWAKLQEFPGRMVEWDADQVSQAYAEATRKLQSIANGTSEAYEESHGN